MLIAIYLFANLYTITLTNTLHFYPGNGILVISWHQIIWGRDDICWTITNGVSMRAIFSNPAWNKKRCVIRRLNVQNFGYLKKSFNGDKRNNILKRSNFYKKSNYYLYFTVFSLAILTPKKFVIFKNFENFKVLWSIFFVSSIFQKNYVNFWHLLKAKKVLLLSRFWRKQCFFKILFL